MYLNLAVRDLVFQGRGDVSMKFYPAPLKKINIPALMSVVDISLNSKKVCFPSQNVLSCFIIPLPSLCSLENSSLSLQRASCDIKNSVSSLY